MKHVTHVSLAVILLAGTLAIPAHAQDQPLGDYARKVRKEKEKEPPAKKKFDNDNLPVDDKLSVVGPAPAGDTTAENASAKPAEESKEKDANSPQEQQKAFEQWKQKIASEKNQIDLLSRELDVTQREYRVRAAAFYADAGERLRNSAAWDKQDRQYKQQIADKQKALDSAKKQLDDLQEQARKAGVPARMRE